MFMLFIILQSHKNLFNYVTAAIFYRKIFPGFTIALDKRLAADGRGLQQVLIFIDVFNIF